MFDVTKSTAAESRHDVEGQHPAEGEATLHVVSAFAPSLADVAPDAGEPVVAPTGPARAWARARLLIDVVVLCAAAALALVTDPAVRGTTSAWVTAAVFPIATMMMIRARRDPGRRFRASLLDLYVHLLGAVSLTTMLVVTAETVAGTADPVGLAARLWAYSIGYLAVARTVIAFARRALLRSRAAGAPTVIVGAGVVGAHLARRLIEERAYGLRPVGFIDSDPLPTSATRSGVSLPVLGGLENLEDVVRRTGARHVILAFTAEPDQALVAQVRGCEALGVQVSLVPRLYETINDRTTLDHVGGLPLLTFNTIDPQGWEFAVKHTFDRVAAAVAIVFFAPVLAGCAVAVRLSSPGPIWFRQRRVGRDGQEFDLLKFRTMRVLDDSASAFVLPDGIAPGGVEGLDRRTRTGRVLRDFSLDELPQLFNVVRGDMSLVGPRPERPQFVERFREDVYGYEDRHRVRSGITGWAQVHGLRGQTSIADRVEWDNYYIANWSLRLDAKIMLLTVVELLRFRDSWAERQRRRERAVASAPPSRIGS